MKSLISTELWWEFPTKMLEKVLSLLISLSDEYQKALNGVVNLTKKVLVSDESLQRLYLDGYNVVTTQTPL